MKSVSPQRLRRKISIYTNSQTIINVERSKDLRNWKPAGVAIAGDGGEESADVPHGPDDRSLLAGERVETLISGLAVLAIPMLLTLDLCGFRRIVWGA